jgi:hypothetical protein
VIANNLVGAGVDPAIASRRSSRSSSRHVIGSRARPSTRRSQLAEPGFEAAPYLAQEAVSDTSELEPLVDHILEENPGQVAAFRGGKERASSASSSAS